MPVTPFLNGDVLLDGFQVPPEQHEELTAVVAEALRKEDLERLVQDL